MLYLRQATSAEVPIGSFLVKDGMRIGAVYLQSVSMAGDPTQKIQSSNSPYAAHIELDIHATKNNINGFATGEWIPYLKVKYIIKKMQSSWKIEGNLMPMVANDGPHYGKNIIFAGPGEYFLTYIIQPPYLNGFYRHTDHLTGVGEWFQSITFHAKFFFAGVGKAGGY